MQRLLRFKLNRECREIAVNPAKVLYVSHYENGASALHFSKDCFVRVQGELDAVSAKIEAALCDDIAPGSTRAAPPPAAAAGIN